MKIYASQAYYWVGSRGLNKQQIFKDSEDYQEFIALLKRHLTQEVTKDRLGRPYEKIYAKVEVVAYCLLPSNFQLMIYQYDADGLPDLMRRVLTGYTMYFNKKHNRSGSLFQSRYKAVLVHDPMEILKISRYIHLKPQSDGQDYATYQYSSVRDLLGAEHTNWLRADRLLELSHQQQIDYHAYMANYPEYSNELEAIQDHLADN